MARKKRLYNYEFLDGKQSFERTVKVVCTQTGEVVMMYHKHLARMIEKKYRNRYKVFKTSYIKKGNKPSIGDDDYDEYTTRPEGYRRFLLSMFMHYKNSTLPESTRAHKMAFINDCYLKRWNEPISEVLKRSEL